MRKFLGFALLIASALALCGFQSQVIMARRPKLSGGGGPTVVQPTSSHFWAVNSSGCAIYGSNPTTCAFPQNVSSGHGVYVHLMFGTTGTLATPTSSGTATIGSFTEIGSGCDAATTACGGAQAWYRASVTGSGTLTISDIPPASNNTSVHIWEIANDGGADSGTNPVYAYNNTGCTTGCAIGGASGITPATTGDLIICDEAGSSAATISAVTPYTLIGQNSATGNNLTDFAADYIAPSTSAITGTYTTSAADNMLNSCLAIK